MKKSFRFYTLLWIILLAAFNAVVFLVRPVIPGYTVRYDARFWTAWVFILAAFAGNLACAYFALREENLNRLFYRLPLITVSRTALTAMLVAGSVLMIIPDCPAWIAAAVCVILLACNAAAVIRAGWVAEAVSQVEEKVKTQTAFIKTLTADAESVLARAKDGEAKAACKKVYEAFRYSDPMSNEALAEAESRITMKFNEFSNAVTGGANTVSALADELVVLIGDRNKKCEALK